MKNKILIFPALLAAMLTCSCTEKILIDNIDESAYLENFELKGFVRDANTCRVANNIVELHGEDYQTSLQAVFNQVPKTGVDVQFLLDPDYVGEYNRIHSTSFLPYPVESVVLEADGKVTAAPDQKFSYRLPMTIKMAEGLQEGMTYVLPVKMVSKEGSSEKMERCIYLIKDRSNIPNNSGKEGKMKVFQYFESKDTNPLNATLLVTESGKPYFDMVCLFAADLQYSEETGEMYASFNPTLQYTLDNYESYIKPLQDMGIKVVLAFLGNRDEAGLAQLSDAGAKEVARTMKVICDRYHLDGINFDDEYSGEPDLNNPLCAERSRKAAARLVFECKSIMPDKHMSIFDWNRMYGVSSVDGIDCSEWIDAVYANYGSTSSPLGKMTMDQCSGVSWEMFQKPQGYPYEYQFDRVFSEGYGWFMQFAMFSKKGTERAQIAAMDRYSELIYGEGLRPVEQIYPLFSTTPVPLN